MKKILVSLALIVFAAACKDGASQQVAAPQPAAEAPAPAPSQPAAAPAESAAPAAAAVPNGALLERARGIFGELPEVAENPANPQSAAKVDLGRRLYFETRLSKNHDISCNTCHDLARHGVDGEPTSPGHRSQRGARNSPTVYNAALHFAQFWDGRAADVEEQAKGPILNPIEMAMPSEEAVLAVLRSIPEYGPLFAAAFPGESDPLSYDNLGRAIGAFERTLLTPSRFDAYLSGQEGALSAEEVAGLQTFVEVGCVTCHAGPGVGGAMFQKLGLVEPYPTTDAGRFEVTKNESDRQVFKVPGLRNVAKTAPYFHDGSIAELDEAIRLMAKHQLGRELSSEELSSIRIFLESLTAELDADQIAPPVLPPSGPETPAPDPA